MSRSPPNEFSGSSGDGTIAKRVGIIEATDACLIIAHTTTAAIIAPPVQSAAIATGIRD